jgi:hypothetical protein
MDCFIVMAHLDLDDIPLRTFRTNDEARAYLAGVTANHRIRSSCLQCQHRPDL